MAGNILLTGINGYVGRHAALQMLRAGYGVRGCVRRLSQAEEVRRALRPHLPAEALQRLCFVEVDLLADEAWAAAMVGMTAVVHAAGPFVTEEPANPQDVIRPLVEGTLRVMRMARLSGVRRMVFVSSTSAILDPTRPGPRTEADWADTAAGTAFARGKVMAERHAWDHASQEGLNLTVLNPGLILGPPLGERYGASVGVVRRLLRGRDPMMPLLGLVLVDVRDVAKATLRAIERPEAVGKRYAVVSGPMTLHAITRLLKQTYPRRRLATMVAPRWLLQLYSLWDAEAAGILPSWGYMPELPNALVRADLDMAFIPPAVTVQDTAEWLLAAGQV